MSRLLGNSLRWLLQKLRWLIVILAILLVMSWLQSEWTRHELVRAEIETQASAVEALRSSLARIEADVARQELDWHAQRDLLRQQFEDELRRLDARIEHAEREWGEALGKFGDIERQARKARRRAEEAQARFDALERASAWWDWLIAQEKIAEREQARATFLALDGVAMTWESARDRLAPRFQQSPVAPLETEKARRSREIAAQLEAVPTELQALRDARSAKQREVEALESVVVAQRARLAEEPREKLIAAIRAQLPAALWILVGVMLAPVLIKAFFYFVLAPLAQALEPIRILPDERAPAIPPPLRSAVSLAVDVGAGEEILVHPDFVQSSSLPARKQTQWFLNPRLPFSSLAAGLFAMTRIRPEGTEATRVVVSSQNDPLGEIGLIELPSGASMVVQPRSLAGVVKPVGVPVAITRHWRLGSVHAWLTLQLRYLVFHGPCRLVLKGCRGVRAEQPEPGRPRLINQSATLGFSANLDYRNTRCETFVSYLRGKEDLFNDLFAGGPGWFVYEEMPAAGRRTGFAGRGLEGVADAALKAFGI
jgi:uncharacterized protein (AIM24 family)/uncharacterized tellurite resistance protein B-like protein